MFTDQLNAIATNTVRQNAMKTDAEANFPTENMGALADAGLLGAVSATAVGGMGLGPADAALIVETLAKECASTAMITCMHYAAAAVIERHAPEAVRRAVAQGELATLAFSEAGSRSQFWAPTSTAIAAGDDITLAAKKSWVTSANHAKYFVWSSKPVAKEGLSTIWLVASGTKGVSVGTQFNGLGLKGNDSTSMEANAAKIPKAQMLGGDGEGLGIMLQIVLPLFNLMNASCSLGIAAAAQEAAIGHVSKVGFEHTGTPIAELMTIRAQLAKSQIKIDTLRLLIADTAAAMIAGRADTMLRVLECKAFGNEVALEVAQTAMRVCGGAAFRKEVAIERRLRDAEAGFIMAPTADQLYDFVGKAICGMPVF